MCSLYAESSKSNSVDLSDILVLPATKATKIISKPSTNKKAVCITENEIYDDLKEKEQTKIEKSVLKEREKIRN
jgi:hypothetical protein